MHIHPPRGRKVRMRRNGGGRINGVANRDDVRQHRTKFSGLGMGARSAGSNSIPHASEWNLKVAAQCNPLTTTALLHPVGGRGNV